MEKCKQIASTRQKTISQIKEKSPIYLQLTPMECSALECIAQPILKHITYCEEYDLYFLDQKHLEVNSEFHVGLYPEEMWALELLFSRITGVSA